MASPYPIDGVVYESDGTTAVASALVSAMNVSNGEIVEATTNGSGQYLIECANFPSGYSDGDVISLWVSSGRYYKEELHTIDISVGAGTENISLTDTMYTHALYCSVDDIRSYLRIADNTMSDEELHKMILHATALIDERTGRTWKGIQTVTDEYYDGTGSRQLFLFQTDLVSVTSLAIDNDNDGTYTTVTASYVNVYPEGYITLDTDAEVPTFSGRYKSVKITYTYGHSRPTEDIRHLAILMVANMMNEDPNYRRREIEDSINRLRRRTSSVV